MLLYGTNSVKERLKVNPSSVNKVFLDNELKESELAQLSAKAKIKVEFLGKDKLGKIKNSANTQGVIAMVNDFTYADFDELLGDSSQKKRCFIFLDRIFDPQNLGAIIRTAACFGDFVIVIPKHKACPVTEATLHIACGGENYVPVCLVSNLSNSLIKAKKEGFWIVGSVLEDAKDIYEAELPFPMCLVLGSEGEGIRYGVDKHLDFKIKIPMPGFGLSLNVATAAAIFCYEINRQKTVNG